MPSPSIESIRGNLALIRKTLIVLGMLCLLVSCDDSNHSSQKASFPDPPVFTSANGVLDLLMIAEPSPISLGSFKPTAWVFEVCKTADAQNDACPADSRTASPYGGVRLQLTAGDHLRIKLVNHLPPAPADAEHAHGDDPMMNEMLAANPINLHTHGLIVEPRKADDSDPTYGDYVYVLGYPVGKLPSMVDSDETATDQPIQYDIYIPTGHPSGIFYFHPHVHGLSVNQLSEGLSGVITIGSVSDYLSVPNGQGTSLPVHYFVLKDMQILPTGDAQDQEDADFCQPNPAVGESRDGSCDGADFSNDGGSNYTGGKWFFTVNGQHYPSLSVSEPGGEVWRFLNAGASRSYDLAITDDSTHNPVQFQVVSLDGVALAPPPGSGIAQIRAATGNKVDAVPCAQSAPGSAAPVCATHLVMLPSARAEIWIAPSSKATTATLRTAAYNTGAAGDSWPAAALAHVSFAGSASASSVSGVSVRPVAPQMLSSAGVLGAPVSAGFTGLGPAVQLREAQQIAARKSSVVAGQQGRALTPQQIQAVQSRLASLAKPVPSLASQDCSALPAAHRRRIFFGIPAGNPDGFGLGYEEVDADGNPVPGTFQDIAPFDPDHVNVCLPLGPGNAPVTEEWELVNVAGETHNFHIHQTRFTVETANAPEGDGGVLMDNVPLPNGGAPCDGSIATWRAGVCKVAPILVKIPFAEVGDFVYHCHIGEHQDGGMMAHIRVIASQ
jgi:FtsP/CotA-like multicopper oxidase with cupredoxin domain